MGAAGPSEPPPDPEGDWPVAFAAALADLGGTPVQHGPLGPGETAAILRLAREVAHGVERRYAPLAAYLAGRFVAERTRAGATVDEALAEAAAAAQRLIGTPGEPPT